ncbi:MAG: hypothetical protein J7494_02900 [Sphingobium sp.]|nr:hypothetical protein [Sphingobium sp.]
MSVIGAFSLSAVLGIAAFSVDINNGLNQRVRNQAVADMAALGAALVYQNNGSSSAMLDPTAKDVAAANGLSRTNATAVLVDNYPSSGSKAVKVTITTNMTIAIASAIGLRSSYTVSAISYASLPTATTGSSACFLALATSGNGITTSGGATISTPGCSVAAVASINAGSTGITAKELVAGTGGVTNSFGYITAEALKYATSFTNPNWNTAVPAADKRTHATTTLVDPLASDANIIAARTLLGSYTAPVAPTQPTVTTGTDWVLNYSPSGTLATYWNSSTKTYTIPSGTYNIKALTISGGITVNFTGSSTITISGGVNNGGNRLTFPDGSVTITGGFASGSTGVTFGNANVSIGSGTVTFNGSNIFGNGNVSINSTVTVGGGASITMGAGNHAFNSIAVSGGGWMKMGDGDLDVVSGITVGGSSTVAAGIGSYRLGKNASNDAINLAGSGVMIMGDGAFSANGNITTAGGSRVVFGVTANHFINGSMSIAGSVLFGAGRYTISGNFTNGTGGTTWPFSSTVTGLTYGNTLAGTSVSGYDMAGVNVTFIMGGTLNLAGGAKTKLIASSTTTGGAFADILIDSTTTAATTWGAGAQNVFVGAVHVPNSDVSMSGGSNTLSTGQCFMLIAKTLNLSGGSSAGSACAGVGAAYGGAAGATTIGLVG